VIETLVASSSSAASDWSSAFVQKFAPNCRKRCCRMSIAMSLREDGTESVAACGEADEERTSARKSATRMRWQLPLSSSQREYWKEEQETREDQSKRTIGRVGEAYLVHGIDWHDLRANDLALHQLQTVAV
jgi:hypothetical protein